ncbi:MAG TPA: polysaccharide deacetylase family protein [Desulfosporosinus sp.]|nr:polysaccharide deacetylase family protein [Desulfosporosinus sp.]
MKIMKIFGVLLSVCLIFGSSGCIPIKTPEVTTVNPAQETYKDVTLPNLSDRSSVRVVQETPAVPILYYHSVMQENGNELRMPPKQFEAQMAYLKDRGYRSISLEQLYQATYKGGVLPSRPFVITFDDGYVDNFTTAFPILAQHGFTATIFMVTSYINGAGYLSWGQLSELVANGWEIEGHTAKHPYLTKLDPNTLLSELTLPKELLERELGQPVDFFAYPYGDLNEDVIQALKDTGYLMALTTERGWANSKTDEWHLQRIYCYASMGMNEFTRRLQNPNY